MNEQQQREYDEAIARMRENAAAQRALKTLADETSAPTAKVNAGRVLRKEAKRESRRRALKQLDELTRRFREPRYVVDSVTGYRIDPEVGSSARNSKPPNPIWYVFDSYYGYRTVFEGWREERARALAERLNVAEHWIPLPEVCALFGISRGSVYDRRMKLNISTRRVGNQRVYIHPDDVRLLLEADL